MSNEGHYIPNTANVYISSFRRTKHTVRNVPVGMLIYIIPAHFTFQFKINVRNQKYICSIFEQVI